jgi:iron complex transport system substrate-binding protein
MDDPEKFIAARPDLVLIRPMLETSHPELFEKLRQAGITVVSLQPTNIDQMYAYWQDLGLLTGRTKEATALREDFRGGTTSSQSKKNSRTPARSAAVCFQSIVMLLILRPRSYP